MICSYSNKDAWKKHKKLKKKSKKNKEKMSSWEKSMGLKNDTSVFLNIYLLKTSFLFKSLRDNTMF